MMLSTGKFKELHTSKESRVKAPLLFTFIPGFRQLLISAGPPGVMELMMVPRSWRPEFSPPTTWKPERNKTTHFTLLYLVKKKTNVQRVKDVLLKLSFVHILNVFFLSVIDNLLLRLNPDKIFQCRSPSEADV